MQCAYVYVGNFVNVSYCLNICIFPLSSDISVSHFLLQANKVKVYYGLLKEPDLNIPLEDEDEGEGDGDAAGKPKVCE